MPIEIFKQALKLYEHWIPAFAGMTPVGWKPKNPQSHSRVGGNPDLKFSIGNFGLILSVVPIPFPILLGFGIALFGQSESRYNALKCFCAVRIGITKQSGKPPKRKVSLIRSKQKPSVLLFVSRCLYEKITTFANASPV